MKFFLLTYYEINLLVVAHLFEMNVRLATNLKHTHKNSTWTETKYQKDIKILNSLKILQAQK